MGKSKKVKLINRETEETQIFANPLEVAKTTGYQYGTVLGWISGRVSSPKYTAEYVQDEVQ